MRVRESGLLLLLVIALAAAVLLGGCKAKETPTATAPAEPAATAEAPKAPAPETPKPASPTGKEEAVEAARKLGTPSENPVVKTASGLQYIDVKSGDGAEGVAGKMVSVHYTGWLVNGTKFDSSKDRGAYGTPFQFPLGAGKVIKGWDEGVAGMKVGGVRKLIIPSDLGYGTRGAGNVIPPNATLIFEVELLGIQ